MSFGGVLGLVCIEKWSQNFDSGTRSAILGTPKMAKMTPFCSAQMTEFYIDLILGSGVYGWLQGHFSYGRSTSATVELMLVF